jgi:hypothetical protein
MDDTTDSASLAALRGARALWASTLPCVGTATAGAPGSTLARFMGAMGATIGPDDMLEFRSVASLTEAGAENPVLAAILVVG